MRWYLGILWLASGEMCLSNGIPPEKRVNFTTASFNGTTLYNGPLMLFKLKWASSLVSTKVGKYLLEEVFGYHVNDDGASWRSGDMQEALSGCIKGKDCMAENDLLKPQCHMGFEVWVGSGLEGIPKKNLPETLGLLDYMGEEGLYMSPKIAEAFYKKGRIVTIYSGLTSPLYNDLGDYFLTFRQLLAEPWQGGAKGGAALADIAGKRILVQYAVANERDDKTPPITKFTGEKADAKCCFNIKTNVSSVLKAGCGEAWVSPPSRADPYGCIPIITSVDWGYFLVMQASKFSWPVCYISADWANYVYLGNTFNILIYWWTPDTAFQAINPVEVRVPSFDGLAREAGDWISKTQSKLVVQAWQFIRGANKGRGQFLAKFGFNMAYYDADANYWMSERAKAGSTATQVACSWLKLNEKRWRTWIPDQEAPCEVGQQLDPVTSKCTKCVPGMFASKQNQDRIIWDCQTCDKGLAEPNSGSPGCTQCGNGQFADEAGSTECKNCTAGTFQRAVGQSSCGKCEAGAFSAADGQPSCKLCLIGTYQKQEGGTDCDHCPTSFTTDSVGTPGLDQCTCAKQFYWNRRSDTCAACQPEGDCQGGLDAPTVYEHHYGVYDGTVNADQLKDKKAGDYTAAGGAFSKLSIYTCRTGECDPQPGEPGLCKPRRSGVACGVCAEGYYLKACISCGDGGGPFTMLIVVIILFPFIMWGGSVVCAKPYAVKATAAFQMASTFGIMAIFAQMLGMMGGFNVSFQWPSLFGSLFDLGAIFLLDLEGLGVGCIVGNSFAAQFWTTLSLPVIMAAGMFAVYPPSLVCPIIRGQSFKLSFNGCLNFLGMVYSALYISLVKLVVAYLECVPNPAANATLAKYKQVVCGVDEHSGAMPAFIFGMIFYVVGFFILCLYLNIKAPESFGDPVFRSRTKFLVNRWRVDTWYWGTVYQVRNFLLAMIAVASSTAVDQFIMMAIVINVFLMFGALYMPWKDERLAQFDNSILFVVFIATACGIGFMHLSSQKGVYARDDSLRAKLALEDIDSRLGVFGLLLGLSLGVAVFLFFSLFGYCIWWAKNSARIEKKANALQESLISRYVAIQGHAQFVNELEHYLVGGTYVDLRSFMIFLENVEIRVGVAGDPEASMKVKRLRMGGPKLAKRLSKDLTAAPEAPAWPTIGAADEVHASVDNSEV